jgi:hypothetical protein
LIIVWVPKPEKDSAPSFFVLFHQDAIRGSLKMPKAFKDGRVTAERDNGLHWGSIKPYENKWGSLPSLT